MKSAAAYTFTTQDDGTILVVGGTAPYTIVPDAQGARCSCPAGTYAGRCKHLTRAAELFAGVVVTIAAVPAGPAFEDVPPPEPAGDDNTIADDEPQAVAAAAELQPSALLLAIDEETGAVLDRCAGTLERLEQRAAAALQPSEVMRKYRAARERLAAERAHEAA